MRLDNHALTTWQRCPREGHYAMQRGLTRYETKSVYLLFGSAIHKGLEEMIRNYSPDAGCKAFLEFYQENPWDVKRRDVKQGLEMLVGYWEYWKDWFDTVEVLAMEQYFEYPIGDHIWCGLVDFVFEYKDTKEVGGIDFKTTSSMDVNMIEAMRIRQQFLGYYNWLANHSPYSDRVGRIFMADYLLYAKNSKYATDGYPLRRENIHCTPQAIEQWKNSIIFWADLVEHHYIPSGGLTGMNTESCTRYGSLCQYYDLCVSPVETRDTMIDMVYHIDHWDPKERD